MTLGPKKDDGHREKPGSNSIDVPGEMRANVVQARDIRFVTFITDSAVYAASGLIVTVGIAAAIVTGVKQTQNVGNSPAASSSSPPVPVLVTARTTVPRLTPLAPKSRLAPLAEPTPVPASDRNSWTTTPPPRPSSSRASSSAPPSSPNGRADTSSSKPSPSPTTTASSPANG